MRLDDMNNAHNQSLMSILSPPSGDNVSRFLNLVGQALGCRTDAELAREMDMPASSVANWRRRGKISKAGEEWFRSGLILALAHPKPSAPLLNDIGTNAVIIATLLRHGGNPIGARKDIEAANAFALSGIVAMIRLIVDLARIHDFGAADIGNSRVDHLVDEALPILRRSPMFAGFAS